MIDPLSKFVPDRDKRIRARTLALLWLSKNYPRYATPAMGTNIVHTAVTDMMVERGHDPIIKERT